MIEDEYTETPEEITQEYIAAMKYHVDNGLFTMDELSEVYYEIVDCLRSKGWPQTNER